jgi:hypothetical protein
VGATPCENGNPPSLFHATGAPDDLHAAAKEPSDGKGDRPALEERGLPRIVVSVHVIRQVVVEDETRSERRGEEIPRGIAGISHATFQLPHLCGAQLWHVVADDDRCRARSRSLRQPRRAGILRT